MARTPLRPRNTHSPITVPVVALPTPTLRRTRSETASIQHTPHFADPLATTIEEGVPTVEVELEALVAANVSLTDVVERLTARIFALEASQAEIMVRLIALEHTAPEIIECTTTWRALLPLLHAVRSCPHNPPP